MIANDVSNRVDVVKWKNDVSEVVPLDLDALRLVVDYAERLANEARSIHGVDWMDYNDEKELGEAIAKIETILK